MNDTITTQQPQPEPAIETKGIFEGGFEEDILAEPVQAQPIIVKDLVYPGLNLLGGCPKIGKSLFALQIAQCVARGIPLFGEHFPTSQGKVLYLALEENRLITQDRLRKLVNQRVATSKALWIAYKWRPLEKGGDIDISNYLYHHPEVKLVIIDVLEKIKGDGRKSSYKTSYSALASLQELGNRTGVAILALVHARKDEQDKIQQAIIGSQGQAAAADTILLLKRPGIGYYGTLEVTGRKGPTKELVIKLNEESLFWEYLHEKIGRVSPERQVILEALKFGPKTPRSIALETGLGSGSIWNMLNSLREQGLVVKLPRCHYALSKLGSSEMKRQ